MRDNPVSPCCSRLYWQTERTLRTASQEGPSALFLCEFPWSPYAVFSSVGWSCSAGSTDRPAWWATLLRDSPYPSHHPVSTGGSVGWTLCRTSMNSSLISLLAWSWRTEVRGCHVMPCTEIHLHNSWKSDFHSPMTLHSFSPPYLSRRNVRSPGRSGRSFHC